MLTPEQIDLDKLAKSLTSDCMRGGPTENTPGPVRLTSYGRFKFTIRNHLKGQNDG